MNTTEAGKSAEGLVANKLQVQGYTLLAQNWRTRYCEIDLIMEKNNTVYFIEVKYRSSDRHGSGFDYITPKKLKQMEFAAEMWLQSASDRYRGSALAAAEVSPDETIEFLVIG